MSVVQTYLGNGTGAYIVSQANGYRSREEGVVESGSGKLPAGTVLGRVTATGRYKPFTAGASDGSQTASAILYETIDATSAAVKVTLTVRDTEVHRARLAFSGTPNDSQKLAAYASLAANGIAFR